MSSLVILLFDSWTTLSIASNSFEQRVAVAFGMSVLCVMSSITSLVWCDMVLFSVMSFITSMVCGDNSSHSSCTGVGGVYGGGVSMRGVGGEEVTEGSPITHNISLIVGELNGLFG